MRLRLSQRPQLGDRPHTKHTTHQCASTGVLLTASCAHRVPTFSRVSWRSWISLEMASNSSCASILAAFFDAPTCAASQQPMQRHDLCAGNQQHSLRLDHVPQQQASCELWHNEAAHRAHVDDQKPGGRHDYNKADGGWRHPTPQPTVHNGTQHALWLWDVLQVRVLQHRLLRLGDVPGGERRLHAARLRSLRLLDLRQIRSDRLCGLAHCSCQGVGGGGHAGVSESGGGQAMSRVRGGSHGCRGRHNTARVARP